MLDVDKTKVKLGNATTKLLDLNNTTFVEHTVMDIDSSLSNTEKCSTTENDKVELMKNAIKTEVNVKISFFRISFHYRKLSKRP